MCFDFQESQSDVENHKEAAKMLIQSFDLQGELVGGWIDGDNSMSWSFVNSDIRFTI